MNTPFRAEAAAHRNQRQQLDHLLRITSPHERIVLGGIGLVLLAFIGWALFGSIVRDITVDGLLIAPGKRYEVTSSATGHVLEFFARPGDRIKAGDRIARQTVPEIEQRAMALRDRVQLLEDEAEQAGQYGRVLQSRLVSARAALLQLESGRSARESIVSPIGGEVLALRSEAGDFLSPGGSIALIRVVKDGPFRVVLRLAPRVARLVRPGMQASVTVVPADGATRRLRGEVALVAPGPLPRWLAEMAPAVSASMHRIEVVLGPEAGIVVADGTPCRVRVVLGRHSPISFLSPGSV